MSLRWPVAVWPWGCSVARVARGMELGQPAVEAVGLSCSCWEAVGPSCWGRLLAEVVWVRVSVEVPSVLSYFRRPVGVVGIWAEMMLLGPPLLGVRGVVGQGPLRCTQCRSRWSSRTHCRPGPVLSRSRELGLVPGRSAKAEDWLFPS